MSKSYATTYCDGDQLGCTWSGAPHASTSSRSAQYRGGGRVRDFYDDYGLLVIAWEGWGIPEVRPATMEYATLPGGLVQHVKTGMRQWQLVFDDPSPSLTTIHTRRDYLVEAFKPDLVSPAQPVRLRYTGATTTLEIDAWYVGGLEGSLVGADGVVEQPVVRLLSDDPFWYALGNNATTLITNLSIADADYGVKEVAGAWATINTAFNAAIYAFTFDADGNLYVGGAFTNVGDANGDYIVKIAVDGTISSLGTGANGNVWALLVAPDGVLYAGGAFTSMGGVANTSRIAAWDGSNWTALGTGAANNVVIALAIGIDGTLYASGSFTQMGGIASTGFIAQWDGTTWAAMGTGAADDVNALAIGLDGAVYAGGIFASMGGVSNTAYIAKWANSAWSALGTGMDDGVQALAIAPDGTLYAGGNLHAASGVTAMHIARWNASSWTALGSGTDNIVWELLMSADGLLYVGGAFTTAGGFSVIDRLACWNGSTWLSVPVDLPGVSAVYAIVERQTIHYFGTATSGTASAAGQTTVTNAGSRTAYPKIKVTRAGGTTARVEYLKNESTGDVLYLNYSLLDGETLTIELNYRRDLTKSDIKVAGRKHLTSNHFGSVIGRGLLSGSDWATFGLAPGSNTVTTYVYVAGAPTVTCTCEWRESYWSPDNAI